MEAQIIDFAQWYSGMERSKVEKAYQRFLKERREALSQAAVSGSTYEADEEIEDDRDEYTWEDEMEDEEERRCETALSCSCGAWVISKNTGKALHVADCICGAE